MDMASQVHQALARMEDALEKNENRTAFSLFRKDIIKILCGAGVLKVCSPYYYKSGNIKMDKVAGELQRCSENPVLSSWLNRNKMEKYFAG